MAQGDSDRNLLFGVLALQMDFITRDGLIAAMNAWVLEKSKPLGRILVARGDLDENDFALLDPLVGKHVERHGGDPERSLESLTSVSWLRQNLPAIADTDLNASVTHLGVGADWKADPMETVPPSVGGQSSWGQRFRILRPHASGGLGEVYVARDEELNREVALKQIKGGHADHPESRSRFLLEAEVTGGLEHPGIVPVYGLGHYPDGRPFYAMRFIRGDSLKEAIERFHRADGQPGRDPGERALAMRQLLRRYVDVCNAVAYAHSRGVLHRDLKPGNVMLGPYGETLVVDWGLAKPIGRPEGVASPTEGTLRPSSGSGIAPTQMGSAVGTPAFMSPEQAAGRLDELGPASDVYSLGAMLYSLLTGRGPFVDTDIGEVLRKVQAGEFPPPRQVNRTAPPALEAICLKAMAKEPGSRYPSPKGLADDIEHWLADEPLAAWREPFSMRARRWARRHRTAVSGSAAALVVGVIGLSAMAVVQSRAKSALDAKNLQLTAANVGTTKAKNEAETALAETTTAKRATEEALAQKVAALAQSDESRQRAEAVLAFFQDKVLSAARPKDLEGGLGIDATIRAAVDAAEPAIEKTFADQPSVEASIRNTLGVSYFYLGEPALAIRQCERALELRRRVLGPDHADTLDAMRRLADTYRVAGRVVEAVRVGDETLKRRQAKLGPDHPDTLNSMENLAWAYRRAGRLAEALPLLEEVFKRTRAKLGLDHENTLQTMRSLGDAYREAGAGRLAEALPLLEEALKGIRVKLGRDHPYTLFAMNDLALAYWLAGRHAETIPLLEETLNGLGAKIGPDNPVTLNTMYNLAATYQDVGRLADALPLFEETVKRCRARLGPDDHFLTLNAMTRLAAVYEDTGRPAEALPLLEESLRRRRDKLGPDHQVTLDATRRVANAYRRSGRLVEALRLLEETLTGTRARFGPDHPTTLESRNELALAYEAAGRTGEAEPLLRDTLARRRKVEKPDSPLLADDLAFLGRNLLTQSKWSEAEPLLRESLAIREKALPDDWSRFNFMSRLGGSLLGQERYAEAEPLVIEGYQGMKARAAKIPAQGKPRLTEAAERVVRLYEDWGKLAKAAEWKVMLGLADLPADVFARP